MYDLTQMNRRKGRTQDWHEDAIVNVGFLKLRVRATEYTSPDGPARSYILTSLDNSKLYRFTPHLGLERVA